MGEQLSMLDTMFLELEQLDDSAHMHIGAALIFDPLPRGGTPDITELRDHIRARVGALPRFSQQLSGPHAGPLTWLTWERAPRDFGFWLLIIVTAVLTWMASYSWRQAVAVVIRFLHQLEQL